MNQNFLPPAGNKQMTLEQFVVAMSHPEDAKAWLADYAKATEDHEVSLAVIAEDEAAALADRTAAEQLLTNAGIKAAGMIDTADADASTRQARAAEEAKRLRDEASVVLAEARETAASLDDRAEAITARETAVMSLRTAAETLKDDAEKLRAEAKARNENSWARAKRVDAALKG